MKILNLRFKNLNSLYGEWEIDFTAPEYISDGIFAVTGPTGSGKSTILDAICLALYGRTPRLKSVNNSSNEIMSRQTGECLAEVTFETMSGEYRCQWSQQRARKKADGKLQGAKHEISNAATGDVIASKKREVDKKVEEATGMDFDRFTRSMMLAQGGFAAFLQATADERAPILEQMTGTEIYTNISKKTHEKRSEERSKLELLKAETSGISTLTEEEESVLAKDLAEKESKEKKISKDDAKTEKSIQWLKGIVVLTDELLEINEESERSAKQLDAFKPDREKLQKAVKATEIAIEHVALQSTRDAQEKDKKALVESEEKLPELEKNKEKKDAALKDAEASLVTEKASQTEEQILIKQVRELDTKISGKHVELKTVATELKNVEKEIKSQDNLQKQKETQKKEVEKNASAATAYLGKNKNDSNLPTALGGIKEQINSFKSSVEKEYAVESVLSIIGSLLDVATDAYQTKQKLCKDLKSKYDIAVQQVEKTKASIEKLLAGKLLREHRDKHETLLREQGLIKKIHSLEEERCNLEDEKACPLCGSKNHPYAEGNIPVVGEVEKQINAIAALIANVESEEGKLKIAEVGEKAAKEKIALANNTLVKLEAEKDQYVKDLKRIKGELDSLSVQCKTVSKNILEKLLIFGIKELPQENPDSVYDALKARSDKWQEYNNLNANAEKEVGRLDAEIEKITEAITIHKKSLSSKNNVQSAHQEEVDQYVTNREKLYGTKKPDVEEKQIAVKIADMEATIKSATEQMDKIAHQLTELKSRIKSLENDIVKRAPELANAETSFISNCKKAGFDDEKVFKVCLLSTEDKNSLTQRQKTLDDQKVGLVTRKKDRETKLKQETVKKITDESLDNLVAAHQEAEGVLSTLRENIGGARQSLSANAKAKETIKEKQAQIDLQSKECVRWDNLHSLIGSADGKKYRNFAQGLTFEIMVSHANKQLSEMSNRYLLVRDKEQPLDLNVIDNYQAGEVRSTKNLSGGESFIISLSLALGLSKMASRKVRVDSLFLDEGFGTLDEDALDIALNTLSALQQDGKLIGVISHVSTLKDRISTQINIAPLTGGKSSISGPGCQKKTEIDENL